MVINNVKAVYVEIEQLQYRTNIYYHVVTNCNTWTMYNEKDVPGFIVELMNKNRPVKQWENVYPDTNTIIKTLAYKF